MKLFSYEYLKYYFSISLFLFTRLISLRCHLIFLLQLLLLLFFLFLASLPHSAGWGLKGLIL